MTDTTPEAGAHTQAPATEQVAEEEVEYYEPWWRRTVGSVLPQDAEQRRTMLVRAGTTVLATAVSGPFGVAVLGYNVADHIRNAKLREEGKPPVGLIEGVI